MDSRDVYTDVTSVLYVLTLLDLCSDIVGNSETNSATFNLGDLSLY
jgi:hypothetical protein